MIKNGKVYDPARKAFYFGDVYITDDRKASFDNDTNYTEINAEGCYVTPGFIDYHVHYFNGGADNGVNPDATSFCCGITTAVDGGTCGVSTYEQFEKSIISGADVRLKSLLHVASGGQLTDGYYENLDPANFDADRIEKLFEKYPEQLVGLKTRISNGIVAPELAEHSLKKTIEIADQVGCNVVVHCTDPAMDLEKLCSILRRGDVLCHMYQNKGKENILTSDGSVRPGVLEARERGVLFDACNGRNNFDLLVAGSAIRHGFFPDIISSDLNMTSLFLEPLHSLPRVLSKYLTFGMPLNQILDAVVLMPAKLIHMESLASMAEDTPADITIFKIKEQPVKYYDHTSVNELLGNAIIVPQMTIKNGKIMYCQADFN